MFYLQESISVCEPECFFKSFYSVYLFFSNVFHFYKQERCVSSQQ